MTPLRKQLRRTGEKVMASDEPRSAHLEDCAWPAVDRWSRLVGALLHSSQDCKNLEQWARTSGVARGTLRAWCRSARLPAARSLDFARMLRAVHRSGLNGWRIEDILDVVDRRTFHRLLQRGAVSFLAESTAITPRAFLERQHYIVDARALEYVERIVTTMTAQSVSTYDGRNDGVNDGTSRLPRNHRI
jgi:hypothetical protein